MFYKLIVRPLLFRFSPETIHHFIIIVLRFFFHIPGKAWFIRKLTSIDDPLLKQEVFGLKFKNPVGIAAGFDKNAELYNELSNFGFGSIEIGTVTPKGQPGNPKPRLFRIPADKALINRMGFNNHGAESTVEMLKKRETNIVIGGNIGKNTATPNENAIDDYVTCFETLFPYVDYFVVNVSCPNISDLHELQEQENLVNILNRLQEINDQKPDRKPVLLKISPDLNNKQLDEVIDIVRITRIDGVIATNTTITRNNLSISKDKIQSIGNGGLSGQPIRERATEVIHYLSEKSGKAFPIIAVGGIFTAEDAIEKLKAGASLVQVYTGFIYEGPFIAKKINKGILEYRRKLKEVMESGPR